MRITSVKPTNMSNIKFAQAILAQIENANVVITVNNGKIKHTTVCENGKTLCHSPVAIDDITNVLQQRCEKTSHSFDIKSEQIIKKKKIYNIAICKLQTN